MAVPGKRVTAPVSAPPALADTELFSVDAYRDSFEATVVDVDRDNGRVRLSRTAFFPGGGGQPCDTGTLRSDAGELPVVRVRREPPDIWHLRRSRRRRADSRSWNGAPG
jgi:misacylated tRNA(Ala) deacylase